MAASKMTLNTCFVISPIGKEDSETRKDANDFLELLVQPALEKFNFDVIRADKISRPTFITTDIVRLVQESELCIIDLTGNNPNVFYECGRRHESGKPFIQMVSKTQEERLPFDVSGIRTVTYDLSSARSVLESQRILQQFVQQIVDAGFGDTTSGDSLTSVAKGIERLDRKLSRLLDRVEVPRVDRQEMEDFTLAMKAPNEAWQAAMKSGRMDLAYQTLTRLRNAAKFSEFIAALGIMTSMGEKEAFTMLEDETEKMLANPDQSAYRDSDGDHLLGLVVATSIKQHFINTGSMSDGLVYLKKVFEMIDTNEHLDSHTKAVFANQISMLAWQCDEIDETIAYARIAIKYDPAEPAYWYNLALAYEKKKLKTELDETLEELSKRSDRLSAQHRKLLTKHGFKA